MRFLIQNIRKLAKPDHCLFTPHDLRALLPDLSDGAFKTLLSRAVKDGYLVHFCRGLYLYEEATPSYGSLLFHAASRLRSDAFNYISLETVLSESGIISQIPMNIIFIMSSGRSNTLSCGRFGRIEFVHTCQKPDDIASNLYYEKRSKLWKASVSLALRDMRATHRSLDLINWSLANELI
jgi:predicted transcriptional regulator of viral defense system